MEPTATGADEIEQVWARIARDTAPAQRVWLATSKPMAHTDGGFIIAVPNEFTQNQFASKLRTFVEDALSEAFAQDTRLLITVDPSLEVHDLPGADHELGDDPDSTISGSHGTAAVAEGPHVPAQRTPDDTRPPRRSVEESTKRQNHESTHSSPPPTVNEKYTFDSFVIGASNRFAHAAAVAVAETPGRSYNPLMIYGESGLGKTHLLHAIADYVHRFLEGKTVHYVSSEEFTNEFINMIRDDNAAAFQKKYRDIDVLLIDDIQFLEGKIQTQEEFFHTFNALHNANKQIVITSDRPPKRLEKLEDRLRYRFEWGLLTDVQAPDLETRIAILRKKAAAEDLTVPPEVLEFIASRIHTNIRELEGALIRVSAFASINRQQVDLTLAEIVLRDLIPDGESEEVTPALIIAQTAGYFQFSIEELCGPSRTRALVTARQIAMYLCRELTPLSLPKIGQQFGGRDHTTVINANKRIAKDLNERRALYHQVTELTGLIKQQARQS